MPCCSAFEQRCKFPRLCLKVNLIENIRPRWVSKAAHGIRAQLVCRAAGGYNVAFNPPPLLYDPASKCTSGIDTGVLRMAFSLQFRNPGSPSPLGYELKEPDPFTI